MKNYGYAISKLRKDKGMTQAELGNKIGVTYQAVSKWENNLAQPDITTLDILLRLFGVTMEEFLRLAELGEEGEVAAAPAAEQPFEKPAEQAPPQKQMIGVCSKCGIAVFDDNLGVKAPKLICAKCYEAEQQEKRRKQQAALIAHEQAQKRFGLSFLWGGLITAAAVALLWAFYFESPTALLTAILFYPFSCQLFWDGFIIDVLAFFTVRLNMPGVIVSFSLGGLLDLIVMKAIMFVIGIILTVIIAIFGFFVALFLSPFTFVPALIRMKNEA